MDADVLDRIVENSQEQKEWVAQFDHRRSLYDKLAAIDPEYFVGVKGMRGVGKTVLLLQLARETEKSVYFSADSTLIQSTALYDVVNGLRERGFETVFIDEIHRKEGWDRDVKTLWDEHNVRIFFSGSSALDITETGADLSRRAVVKTLRPASLREYLNIREGHDIPCYAFQELRENRVELVEEYTDVAAEWERYMRFGGVLYPENGFFDAFENALHKVIVHDLAALRDVNVKYENDAYRLLHLIARSPPFEVNYSKIARTLEVSKNFAVRLVEDLAKTGIIIPVLPCKKEGVSVKKEPKIFLTPPLRMFFAEQGVDIDKGALREEFFASQVDVECYLKADRGEKTPDFRFDDTVVEVGGPGKSAYQDPDYIAVDGLSTADNRIPLFLFGFLH